MKNRRGSTCSEDPLPYCRTQEDFKAYKQVPVKLKFAWLEAQMQFFHGAMTARAKEIRERFRRGELS